MSSTPAQPDTPPALRRRIFLAGATGTIGRATVAALTGQGHEVVCLVRPRAGPGAMLTPEAVAGLLPGAIIRFGDVTDAASLARDGFCGERFDVLVSCLASRSGTARDAWSIDHAANLNVLNAAKDAGVRQVVHLSAICVQKPVLPFQHAKLAYEEALMASGLAWSIVRPTAFFKSLSGQVDRVRNGKPYLLFGDGALTACKPISDRDLASYLAGCVQDESRCNRVLPIGGPGDAITPREQGEALFELLGRAPRFQHVPVVMIGGARRVLAVLGALSKTLADKAELAAIGHYYATESMLVIDPRTGRYDAAATPSTGADTLFEHYASLLRGDVQDDRGDHAVF